MAHQRLIFPAALAVAIAFGVYGAPAKAETVGAMGGIPVEMNQAKIVKLSRPADTIVIGNPDIADASVQDSSTIVLTGRGFGVTNLVVLDEDGSPIVDEQVFVSRQTSRSVRVYRRAQVQTLSCTPFCESAYQNEAETRSETELNEAH